MQQLCWNPRRRVAELLDIPAPAVQPGMVLVQTACSIISAGTERSNTQLSLAHPLQLARSRPDLVAKVKRMARSQGLRRTWEAVQNRVGALQAIGYSCAGRVQAVGDPTAPFALGDAIACAGAGYAVHAEQVLVPYNLCARMPNGCDFEAASTGALGAIAMQGFRLSRATLGERVLVIGLGLIGQLAARIALAAGCTVAGLDPDEFRGGLMLAQGASNFWTPTTAPEQADFDAVIVAAAASTPDVISSAARLARSRGRVVAIGLFPLVLPRDLFYHKELEFVVSRSTGPGRYDPSYEELGLDYPIEYVRWTEQRNLGAYLDLVARQRLQVADLITHRFPIAAGPEAYKKMQEPAKSQLGLLLCYPQPPEPAKTAIHRNQPPNTATPGQPRIALIGAGQFARGVLLPALSRLNVGRASICSRHALQGSDAAKRFGFSRLVSDPADIFEDPGIDAVMIATRHDSHAELVCRGLDAGKAVFVEKPLAISQSELGQVSRSAAAPGARLLVGFNRRFAPLANAARRHLTGNEDRLMVHYRVNAGYLPPEDWTQVPQIGGGRIVGEACHFIDWICFLSASVPIAVYAAANRNAAAGDELTITLTMANSSVGVITYTAGGSSAIPKERIEVFGAGKSVVIDDWQSAELASGAQKRRLRKPGKGHAQELAAWVEALRTGNPMPITVAELITTTAATFAVAESLNELRAIPVPQPTPAGPATPSATP